MNPNKGKFKPAGMLSIINGVAIGMTYGKTMAQALEIGSMLAASVITSSENVCPRFQPSELGLNM